ncbi:hypothetical protein HPP92_012917 [Vanilla planifolia]|uniref:Uncharacterized protein n=1 Tax=Vanilla planifolia TaxID=51239 RepID=A0A835QMF7_VANPL|nr:hypothetical protein HPP92_012917 [Vanilla planifolia]
MRTTADSVGGKSSTAIPNPSLPISGVGLRRNQVGSLELAGEEQHHRLVLLHYHLADSLQSLLPPPAASSNRDYAHPSSSASVVLSMPFLYKLLDALLTCESDFKSLLLLVLSRKTGVISRPPLDRGVHDLLDGFIKMLDLCNAVSVSLQSLRHWNRQANIAATALHRPNPPSLPPQLSRARRALSKLLLSDCSCLDSSSSTCRRVCQICPAARHLNTVTPGILTPRNDSGGAAVLVIAVITIRFLLRFAIWAMVTAFSCSGGTVLPLPPLPLPARQMPWAAPMSSLQERIAEELRTAMKEKGAAGAATTGMLVETLAVERSGRKSYEDAEQWE